MDQDQSSILQTGKVRLLLVVDFSPFELTTNSIVFFFSEESVSKQINEYKVKLQKADQEIATLQASVSMKTLEKVDL